MKAKWAFICFLLFPFVFSNLGFSMGYGRKIRKIRPRLQIARKISQGSGAKVGSDHPIRIVRFLIAVKELNRRLKAGSYSVRYWWSLRIPRLSALRFAGSSVQCVNAAKTIQVHAIMAIEMISLRL
jgi:hypothetical protein